MLAVEVELVIPLVGAKTPFTKEASLEERLMLAVVPAAVLALRETVGVRRASNEALLYVSTAHLNSEERPYSSMLAVIFATSNCPRNA